MPASVERRAGRSRAFGMALPSEIQLSVPRPQVRAVAPHPPAGCLLIFLLFLFPFAALVTEALSGNLPAHLWDSGWLGRQHWGEWFLWQQKGWQGVGPLRSLPGPPGHAAWPWQRCPLRALGRAGSDCVAELPGLRPGKLPESVSSFLFRSQQGDCLVLFVYLFWFP